MNVFDLIDPSFSYRLIITLMHFLWQGSLVALLAVLGDTLLRRATASLRYTLHVAAMTIMIACVAVTFSKVASPIKAASVWTKLIPIVPTTELFVQDRENVDSSDRPSTFATAGVETPLPESPATVGSVENVKPPRASLKQPSGNPNRGQLLQHYAPEIVVLYFICCGLLLARLARGTWVAHQMRRSATTMGDDSLIAMLQRQSKTLGLQVMPRVAWCAEVSIPLVIGIFTPVILLPVAAATGLTPDQLQALIMHELAHIRRYDLLANLVQRIVESLLFFHPAVWYISRRISSEREQACDELVLATGFERLRYADALVRMAELSSSLRCLRTSPTATTLAASGSNSSEFKRRVLKVLSVPTTSDLQPSRIALLVIMALIVGAALSASNSHINVLAETPPQPSPTEIMPPVGLEFLKPYPKLHGLSLNMTESQFLDLVEQMEMKARKMVDGDKVTHHIALGDGHNLIVMFDKDANCSGIQRMRGDEAAGRTTQPGKYSARLPNGVEVELAGVAMENVAYSDKSKWRKDDAWWRADGTRLQAPPMTLFSSWGQEAQNDFREFAIKLIPPGDAALITASHVSWTPYPRNGSYGLGGWDISAGKPGFLKLQHSAGFHDEKPVAVHVFVSDQPLGPAWLIDVNGLALPQKPADAKTESLRTFIQVVGIEKTDKETIVRTKQLPADLDQRLEVNLTAINQNGQSYSSSESRGSDAGQGRVFELAAADVKYFEIRLRPMTHCVTFENVSLIPGHATDVTVKVEAVDLLTPQPAAAADQPASAALKKMADELATLLPTHWHPLLVGGQSIEMMPGMYATSEDRPHVVLVFTVDKTRPAMKWERKDEQYEYLGKTPHGHGHLFVSMKITGDAANSEVMKLFDWPEASEFVKAFLKGDHAKLTALRKQVEPVSAKASDEAGTSGRHRDLSLADRVRDFNDENQQLNRGLNQPALTEEEVIAVINRNMWLQEDPPLNEQEIRAFKGVAESKRLPEYAHFHLETEDQTETFVWKKFWRVQLMLPAIGHDGHVGLTIRDTRVAEEKIDSNQVAWGESDAEGLTLGIYLSPRKAQYAIGDRVRLRFFVRNNGQQPVKTMWPGVSVPMPDAFTVTDQAGAMVAVNIGHENWDSPWTTLFKNEMLGVGDVRGLTVPYEISIGGDGSRNSLIGRVINARPGQTLQLKVRERNGSTRKEGGEESESGSISFTVAEGPIDSTATLPKSDENTNPTNNTHRDLQPNPATRTEEPPRKRATGNAQPAEQKHDAEQQPDRTAEPPETELLRKLVRGGKIDTKTINASITLVAARGAQDTEFARRVLMEFAKSCEGSDQTSQSRRYLLAVLTDIFEAWSSGRWRSQLSRFNADDLPQSVPPQVDVKLEREMLDRVIQHGCATDRSEIANVSLAVRQLHHTAGRAFLRDVLRDPGSNSDPFAPSEPVKTVPQQRPQTTPTAKGKPEAATTSRWKDNTGGGWTDAKFVAAVGLAELGEAEGIEWLLARAQPNKFGIDGSLWNFPHIKESRGSLRESSRLALADLFGLSAQVKVTELEDWWRSNQTKFIARPAMLKLRGGREPPAPTPIPTASPPDSGK